MPWLHTTGVTRSATQIPQEQLTSTTATLAAAQASMVQLQYQPVAHQGSLQRLSGGHSDVLRLLCQGAIA